MLLIQEHSVFEYAQWLEDYANDATKYLKKAEVKTDRKNNPEFRRMHIDVSMQSGLGLFFGAKFRSAVLYEIFVQTGDRSALEEALKAYRSARGHWADVANIAKDVYKPDITIGEKAFLRGHWLDRLPAIDEDIADMAKKQEEVKGESSEKKEVIQSAIHEVLGRPHRAVTSAYHKKPVQFSRGQRIDIEVALEKMPKSVRLFYRHVNQAERFQNVEMQLVDKRYKANIPADYINSLYPIQYYFIIRDGPKSASLYPGFDPNLANQPYFLVRQT